MKRSVMWENTVIEYDWTPKKVKNINLRLRRDGLVAVSAPRRMLPEKVDAFILSHGEWIARAQQKMDFRMRQDNAPYTYKTGDTIQILGKLILLYVEQGDHEHVEWKQDTLLVVVKQPADEVHKRQIIRKYLEKLSDQVFRERLNQVYPLLVPYGVAFPELRTRWMKSRWGSCSYYDKRITINKALVIATQESIDSVLLHELVHFLHHDHSVAFYAQLTAIMPAYKQYHEQLKQLSPMEWYAETK